MLPLPAQTIPSLLHSWVTVPPSKAKPLHHIHVQPGKLRHGMHMEGFWSIVASQSHWGQAQGWPHLASLPSELWEWGRGEMLLVTGVPPGLPTHRQPRAPHSQRYSRGFQQLNPIPGMGTRL